MIDFSSKKFILFDLDGTLFNTLPDLAVSINVMLQQLNLSPLSFEQVKGFIGNGSRNLVRRCLMNSGEDPEKAHALFYEYYRQHCAEKTVPYPGVMDVLNKNFRAAVLTNKPIVPTRRILSHFGLLGRFEFVLGGDSTLERKPSPAGIEYILNSAKVEKKEALMIGDDLPDLFASKAAGIDSVMLLKGFGKAEEILSHFPENSVEHFPELLNLFS